MGTADEDQASTAGDRRQVVQWHPVRESTVRPAAPATISPLPGWPTTGFNAHGGVVMYNPSVFAIYWGRDYGSLATGTNQLVQQFDQFLGSVLNSRYIGQLSQYNVNLGTFLGSTWIDHDPGTMETFTTQHGNSSFAARLSAWINAGLTFSGSTPVVPASDEHDLLFVVFPPAEVTVATPDGSTTGFCGFHYNDWYNKSDIATQANLFYAIVLPGSDSSVVAHELSEAFTDRDGNGWHSDDTSPTGDPHKNYPEIADVCNACGVNLLNLTGFQVASYWLVNGGRCLQQADIDPIPLVTVPDVTNLTPGQARARLTAVGFAVTEAFDPLQGDFKPYVEDQFPFGGTQAPEGSTVSITVAVPHKGPPV
jgi:hypothetical protein